MPKMKKPKSRRANVTNHSYDPDNQELTVTFHSGARYIYHGVSKEIADGLRDAPSKGSYLHAHIIGKHHHFLMDR